MKAPKSRRVNVVRRIEIERDKRGQIVDFTFYFIDAYGHPWNSREFIKGSKTQKRLERIQEALVKDA